jgi:lambda family phage tail tape measure protein
MSEGNVQLKLRVNLDLAAFRKDLGKLAQAAAAYYYPINLQVNKRNFTRQLENIGRTLGTRKYNVNVDDTSIKAASIQVDRLAEKLKKLSGTININTNIGEAGGRPGTAMAVMARKLANQFKGDIDAAARQMQTIRGEGPFGKGTRSIPGFKAAAQGMGIENAFKLFFQELKTVDPRRLAKALDDGSVMMMQENREIKQSLDAIQDKAKKLASDLSAMGDAAKTTGKASIERAGKALYPQNYGLKIASLLSSVEKLNSDLRKVSAASGVELSDPLNELSSVLRGLSNSFVNIAGFNRTLDETLRGFDTATKRATQATAAYAERIQRRAGTAPAQATAGPRLLSGQAPAGALAIPSREDPYRVIETQVRNAFDIIEDYHKRQAESFANNYKKVIENYHRRTLSSIVRSMQVTDLGGRGRPLLPSGRDPLMLPGAGGTTPIGQMRFNAVTTGVNPPPSLPMLPAAGGTTPIGQMRFNAVQSGMGARRGGGFVPAGGFPSDGIQGPRSAMGGPRTELPSGYLTGIQLAQAATDSFGRSQLPLIGGLKALSAELGLAAKQVLLYGTAYKGLAFLTSLPGQLLDAAKTQQQYTNSLQVVTEATGTYAKELLYVDQVQRTFGLDLQSTRKGFVDLYASMAPTGFDSDSIQKLFTGISAASAALQLTPATMDRVIYAFAQMASKGQIMSEELKRQLGDALPGALGIFASAAGMSIKEFNEALEAGEFTGNKFKETIAKVTDELMNRFGTGAQVAGKSLQGLINTVGGDFKRLLESFAPLSNAAAQSILKPLGGALRQLSVAAKLSGGEQGRLSGQITQQEVIVAELGKQVQLGGPDVESAKKQYEGAKGSLEALKIQLENLNELAKDPAIAEQAKNIQAFTTEISKAATFVQNFAMSIGSFLSPILTFLGTNLNTIIGTIVSLTLVVQGAKLGMLAFAGVMTLVKGTLAAVGLLKLTVQLGSFQSALAASGVTAKTVAAIYTSLGIGAKAGAAGITLATGATLGLKTAIIALMATTGIGLLIALVGTLGAAFAAMGQQSKQAAEDSKQAAKDMAEAARTGNVQQVESGLKEANAQLQLIEDVEKVVQQKSGELPGNTRFPGQDYGPRFLAPSSLTAEELSSFEMLGISLPSKNVLQRDLEKRLKELRTTALATLGRGEAQMALAQKQRARMGEGIPSLGIGPQDTEEGKEVERRGKTLLSAIEQREDAIAQARKQQEESIAKIRKNAAEESARMERSFADRRKQIEREIASIRQNVSDDVEDIERRIRINRGEDRDLVEIEQKIADIAREERDSKAQLAQRIADEEEQQARNIADFQKNIAKQIQEANEAHTKRMGEIQQGYAKQVAKIIDDGTGKAAKRLTAAGELAAKFIERASLQQTRAGILVDGMPLPPIPRPVTSGQGMTYPGLSPEQVPDAYKLLDRRILELERNLQSSRRFSGIGEQFTALLNAESGFEDIAGVEPLPLQRMYQQIGRPFTKLYESIQRDAKSLWGAGRKEINKMLAPSPQRTEAVLKRAERVESVRQTWTPLEAESRSRLNQTNPNPRSRPSQASPATHEGVVRDLSRRVFKRLNEMPGSIYGILGDLSDYLEKGEREVLRKGIEEQLKQGVKPAQLPIGGNINTGRAHLEQAVKDITAEILGNKKSIPRAPASTERELLLPIGGDSEWLERYMRQTEPPLITPGVESQFEGASLLGDSFDISKVATDFGTIASASILRGVLGTQIAQAMPLVTVPFSQQTTAPSSVPVEQWPEASRATKARQDLLREGQDASLQKREARTGEIFTTITAESQRAKNDLIKQIDSVRKQSALVRQGIDSELAEQLVTLEQTYNKEIEGIERVKQANIEKGMSAEKALDLAKEEQKAAKAVYETNVRLTKELRDQAKIKAGEEGIQRLKEEIGLLLIANDEQRRLAELRKDFGEAEAQKIFDLEKTKKNIEDVRDAASAMGDAFGEAFKGVITGSASVQEALAGMFRSIADSFADMVAKMIAEWLKAQLIRGFMSLFPGGSALAGATSAASTGLSFDPGGMAGFSAPWAFANGGIASGGFQAFANGGIVKGPTLGLVGEGRYNEAIVPLPDGKSIPVDLGGGASNQINSNITVNVNNGQAQSNAMGSNSSELGRKIEGAVKQVIVGELRPGGLLAR